MGMKPHEDVTLVDKSLFRKDLVVADTVYNPEKTKMIVEAEVAGCKAIGGVGMFQQQAVNYELFVGARMPLVDIRNFRRHRRNKRRIRQRRIMGMKQKIFIVYHRCLFRYLTHGI